MHVIFCGLYKWLVSCRWRERDDGHMPLFDVDRDAAGSERVAIAAVG